MFGGRSDSARALARMVVAAGISAIVAAFLFARATSASYAVARLQPLRIYHAIYAVMFLVIGAFVGQRVLKQRPWRWVLLFVVLGGGMLLAQVRTFPDSGHIEFPWSWPPNGWEQGFIWIKNNTPRDVAFALDANYITANGEDTQNFRAIAERSALPDYVKDGGIATIEPSLSGQWFYGEEVQRGLDDETDAQRVERLSFSPVTWIVLPRIIQTNFPCVFRNDSIQVCRMPRLLGMRLGSLEAHRASETTR